ncbi:MAG: ABC transporter permease [Terriglobales bacterium]
MRLRQGWVVFQLELGKTLLNRRSLWIYALALLPLVPFTGMAVNTLQMRRQHDRWLAIQRARRAAPLTSAGFAAIHPGMPESDVRARLGLPADTSDFTFRNPGPGRTEIESPGRNLYYATPDTAFDVVLKNGVVRNVRRIETPGEGDVRSDFAIIFQFFMLHGAIFFGALGIFMNLFRGELLDQSLHFYFLAPIRREVVLAGKFAAGLVTAGVVFCASVAAQMALLAWQMPPAAREQFLTVQHGWHQIAVYFGITLLACLAYGAFFCAAGLFTRNPILPAALLLIWEGINPFLPALLKKFSIIYYLGALLPLRISLPPQTPALFQLLVSDPDALSPAWALLGLLCAAALLLACAARRVRTLELDYTAE